MKKTLDELDHPCRNTCSGWQQGYERGVTACAELGGEFDEEVAANEALRMYARLNTGVSAEMVGFTDGARWQHSQASAQIVAYKCENILQRQEIAQLKEQLEFTKLYLDPVSTSFRTMIDNFMDLTKEQQEKLIDLAKALAALGGEG